MISNNPTQKIIEWLMSSRYAVAFTGSGVSAESGITTFRGKNGLWNKYRAEDLATLEGFLRNPELVWEWYSWRIEKVFNAKPNPAHIALAKLEKNGIIKTIITQNVDGLHQKAGAKNVIELHGSIWRVKCIKCGYKTRIDRPYRKDEIPPRCPECGSLLRPDVVWFGEPLPQKEYREAVSAAINSDLMLVIGTSGVVYPAAAIPHYAKDRGARIVVINPDTTGHDDIADIIVREKAGSFFSKIISLMGL